MISLVYFVESDHFHCPQDGNRLSNSHLKVNENEGRQYIYMNYKCELYSMIIIYFEYELFNCRFFFSFLKSPFISR